VWAVNATPPSLCPWNRPDTHLKEAEWASTLIWMDLKKLVPYWIQTVERLARGSHYTGYSKPTTTEPGNNKPDIYVGHPTVL